LPKRVLSRLDAKAKKAGETRSGFIAVWIMNSRSWSNPSKLESTFKDTFKSAIMVAS
jgi:hypothetical protein